MPTILFTYTILLINVNIFSVNLCIKILNFAIITIFMNISAIILKIFVYLYLKSVDILHIYAYN